MAISKSATTIRASASVGAATTVTDTSVNLTAGYGGMLTWKITNGGSAPTTVPTIEIQVSHDNSNWYRHTLVGGDITASSVNSRAFPISGGVMYIRTVCIGGATNASTMEAYLEQVTGY
jgi:hypothetical protein